MIVQLTLGRKIFCSTCVKPWVRSVLGKDDDADIASEQDDKEGSEYIAVVEDFETRIPRTVRMTRGSAVIRTFAQNRKDYLNGLLQDGTL